MEFSGIGNLVESVILDQLVVLIPMHAYLPRCTVLYA